MSENTNENNQPQNPEEGFEDILNAISAAADNGSPAAAETSEEEQDRILEQIRQDLDRNDAAEMERVSIDSREEPEEEYFEEIPGHRRIKKGLLIALASVAGVIVLLLAVGLWYIYGKTSVYPGVTVMGEDFSNLKAAAAQVRMNELNSEAFSGKNLEIVCGDKNTVISAEELKLSYDMDTILEKVLAYGHSGTLKERIAAIRAARRGESALDLTATYDEGILTSKISALANTVNASVKQYSFSIGANEITVTAGTSGYALNEAETLSLVKECISKGNFEKITVEPVETKPKAIDVNELYTKVYRAPVNAYVKAKSRTDYSVVPSAEGRSFDKSAAAKTFSEMKEGETVSIPIKTVKPTVEAAMLEGREFFTDLLSTASSNFKTSKVNRTINVKLAAKYCNGVVLNYNDVFSFNGSVGPRTTARGFKSAAIFAGGEVVDGIGGGICQVSSTIYMAVLKAELPIVTRSSHRFAVSYTPVGQDATVVYGSIDFKYKNDRAEPVYMETVVEDGKLTVNIYGTAFYYGEGERTVELYTEILSTTAYTKKTETDNSLAPGKSKISQEGTKGYTCNVYRIIKVDGVEQSREKVNHSTYSPCTEIIKVGPAASTTPTPTAAPTAAPTATATPAPTATATPAPTATTTPEPTVTEAPTPTAEPTSEPTATVTPTVTP